MKKLARGHTVVRGSTGNRPPPACVLSTLLSVLQAAIEVDRLHKCSPMVHDDDGHRVERMEFYEFLGK